MTITNEPDLSGREAYLASKECEGASEVVENEQDSKGIDWAEFDKQDQIIFSYND